MRYLGDFRIQIDGVAQQPLRARRQVFNLRIAGVGTGVEDRDRALHQVQLGRVREPQAVERMFGMHGGVVDRNLFSLHRLGDDRQHRRLLSRQGDRRFDFVLEKFAEVRRFGRRLYAVAERQRLFKGAIVCVAFFVGSGIHLERARTRFGEAGRGRGGGCLTSQALHLPLAGLLAGFGEVAIGPGHVLAVGLRT